MTDTRQFTRREAVALGGAATAAAVGVAARAVERGPAPLVALIDTSRAPSGPAVDALTAKADHVFVFERDAAAAWYEGVVPIATDRPTRVVAIVGAQTAFILERLALDVGLAKAGDQTPAGVVSDPGPGVAVVMLEPAAHHRVHTNERAL